MRATAVKFISAAVLAMAPALARPALAGETSTLPPPTTPGPTGIQLHILTISMALKLGIELKSEPYLVLGSNVCGPLQVKASSQCELIASPDCMVGCDPLNFAAAAYNQCHPGCQAAATVECKSACNTSCKSICLADCNFDPVIECEAGCAGRCTDTCADLQANGVDPIECEVACDATCTKGCEGVAAVSNIDNCGVQCGESCQAECLADANMACEIGCQTEAINEETSTCKTGCYAAGSLACDGKPASGVADLMQCVELLKSFGVSVATK